MSITKGRVFKDVIVYTLLLLIGTSSGYGVMLGYKEFTEPKLVLVGDYTQHFETTDKKVIMYGTDWCPVCERTREFFIEEGIAYKELNPEKDEYAFELYKKLGANGYPIIVIGNKRIFGLDTKEIKLALNER